MKVAKVYRKGLTKDATFVQVVKVGAVKFDPRPGWMLVGDAAKRLTDMSADLFWMHPADTRVEWVRDFAGA